MKRYIATTGLVFAAITVAHIARVALEGWRVADPWWVALTIATSALAVWAWRLVRRPQ